MPTKILMRTAAQLKRYQALMKNVRDGIHIMDINGDVVEVNDAFCEMLGYTRSQASKLNIADWNAQYSKEQLLDRLRNFIGKSMKFETVHRRRDGTLIDVEISTTGVEIDGQPYFFASSRDITARKQADRKLLITQFVTDHAPESILWVDEQARIVYANEATCRNYGYTREEMLTKTVFDIDFGAKPDGWPAHWKMLQQKGSITIESRHLRSDGSIFLAEVSANLLKFEGRELNIVFIRDITERKRTEEEIHQLAFYDPLTQLPNRRLLRDRLTRAIAASRRSHCYGALMFLDLDNFKPLNDAHGHDVGDLLLVEVARRLNECVREADTVARFGGDEFMVMLGELSTNPAASATQVNIVAEKIRAALAEPYVLEFKQRGKAKMSIEHHCSSSIGVALFINHEGSADDIVKWADIAMYQAKEAGRNLVRFYDVEG